MFDSTEIISFSQNYQDTFALLCNDYKQGKFVDIGCSYPNHFSNVVTLIHNDWHGLGFDLKSNLKQEWDCYNKFIEVFELDVVKQFDKIKEAMNGMPAVIDYLNVDIDGYPCQYAIESIEHDKYKFKAITIEHDAYRFGDEFKTAQRSVLLPLGYKIAITTAAEDWYYHPDLLSAEALKVIEAIPQPHMIVDANVHDLKKYMCFNGTHGGPY